MPPLIITLFVIVLLLTPEDVPELEPFDESALAAAFDHLRGRSDQADEQQRPTPAPIRFVGTLIKRLPTPLRAESEPSEA